MSGFEFGLVVPCYNFEKNLEASLKQILDWRSVHSLHFILCLVDDGSSDETPKIAARFQEKHADWVRFTALPKNSGKGFAVREGTKLLVKLAPFIFFTDCDLYYGLDLIPERMVPMLRDGADIVMLDRSWDKQFHAESLTRKFLSHAFNHLKTILTAVPFEDSQAGMKGFRSEFIEASLPLAKINGFAFDVELLSMALLSRFRVERVPIRLLHEQTKAPSSVNFRRASRMLIDLLRIAKHRFSCSYTCAFFQERISKQMYLIRDQKTGA
jgi:glycosyltransferase involved in cell wall biosynthesis